MLWNAVFVRRMNDFSQPHFSVRLFELLPLIGEIRGDLRLFLLASPLLDNLYPQRIPTSMAAATSLYTASTGLCADSVESAPGCRGFFALATYQVDKLEQQQAQAETSSATVAHGEDDDDDDDSDRVASTSTSPAYTRRGTCSLYYAHKPSEESTGGVECAKVDTIETPAILDMKWSLSKPDDGIRRILGVANAKGQVTVHRLRSDSYKTSSKATLSPLGELHFNDRNVLCLSLDFSDRKGGHAGGYDMSNLTADTAMIVSQSDGSLAYLPSLEAALSSTITMVDDIATEIAQTSIHNRTDEGNEDDDDEWDRTSEDERLASLQTAHSTLNSSYPSKPRGLVTWAAHDFEAWIAAFDCFNPTTVWSGGDDLTLKGWDLRSVSSTTPTTPTFACTKPFNGGVTSLQSHHLRQHLWAVGSYDSYLRLFDARMPARPLSETNVGGGVWRVKWHPDDPRTLLVGCMHDGFKVLRLDDLAEEGAGGAELRGKEFDVVTRFDAHESLAYGCDWDRGEVDAEGAARRVYSCSFYDATLHIWDSQGA
ncbi:hypothetical protein PHSY_003802 [Pseudozyma hubeiensis SY62]|uniref:methylated diphthine methylhydrolase n=1 Tax=Pseudozyma hubeiensis (strain SY62) TaxID=1305764 RepID=R9P4P7_PSEHS|nr:hypothetical protein PHSY_003802 [Pseudozyma hubeiensis SY62]GAC96222.1 hypothetical protein PHSY_003802 [Pseudozyma hubeiensis SY62]